MKRNIRKDIRWNGYEIERIEAVLDGQDFSEFVRNATMEQVTKREHELSNTKEPSE